MKTSSRPRTWSHLLDLYPGSFVALVQALDSNRSTVWQLKTGSHRKVPLELLGKLAQVLANGTADGSVAPTREELTAAYMAAFRGTP